MLLVLEVVSVDIGDFIKGDFLSAEDLQRAGGPLVAISGEAMVTESVDSKGETYHRLEIPVTLKNGETRKYSANATSARSIAQAFGPETKKWNGKMLSIQVVKQKVGRDFRDVLYAQPGEAPANLVNSQTSALK